MHDCPPCLRFLDAWKETHAHRLYPRVRNGFPGLGPPTGCTTRSELNLPCRVYEDLASGHKDHRPGFWPSCLKSASAWQYLNRSGVWIDCVDATWKTFGGSHRHTQSKQQVGLKVLAGAGAQIDTTTTHGQVDHLYAPRPDLHTPGRVLSQLRRVHPVGGPRPGSRHFLTRGYNR